jgi:hypothetical protein
MLEKLKAQALKKAEEMKLKHPSISSNLQGNEVFVTLYDGQLQFTVTAADLDVEKKSK